MKLTIAALLTLFLATFTRSYANAANAPETMITEAIIHHGTTDHILEEFGRFLPLSHHAESLLMALRTAIAQIRTDLGLPEEIVEYRGKPLPLLGTARFLADGHRENCTQVIFLFAPPAHLHRQLQLLYFTSEQTKPMQASIPGTRRAMLWKNLGEDPHFAFEQLRDIANDVPQQDVWARPLPND